MAREMKAQADAAADEWRQEAAAAVEEEEEEEEENEEEGEEEAEEGRRAAWSSFGNAVDEEEECAAMEGRKNATNGSKGCLKRGFWQGCTAAFQVRIVMLWLVCVL